MSEPIETTLILIEGPYPRRFLSACQNFKDINGYLVWESQSPPNEPIETRGVTTMLYLNRRAKIKLIKKICPDYQIENLRVSDYTAQELSETWQDDDLLDEILCELIEALPNDETDI